MIKLSEKENATAKLMTIKYCTQQGASLINKQLSNNIVTNILPNLIVINYVIVSCMYRTCIVHVSCIAASY